MDRGAWWATVHVVAKNQTQLKQLGTHAHVYVKCLLMSLDYILIYSVC